MKWKLVLAAMLLALTVCAQQFSNKLFWLEFDYPADVSVSNVVFRAHSTKDIMQPYTNWSVVVSDWIIKSTNSTNNKITIGSSNRVLANMPVQFFVASASNEWGIFFSKVLATTPPREGERLRLIP